MDPISERHNPPGGAGRARRIAPTTSEDSNLRVAKGDDGASRLTRRRPGRPPMSRPAGTPSTSPPPAAAPADPGVAAPPAEPVQATAERPLPKAARLDDLYRMPMPKLFALAEREG